MNKPYLICLVDDDKIYQFGFKKILELSNYSKKVLVFSDGEEALDFLLDNTSDLEKLPDVIFLDINMPIMDGFQFMEEFIKLKPQVGKEITIYMVSSSIDPKDIERAKRISEISDYIIKPISIDILSSVIDELEKNRK